MLEAQIDVLKLCPRIFSAIVVLAFFSFGTFGFFNLFGLSLLVKFVAISSCIVGVMAILQFKKLKNNKPILIIVLIFFAYFGIMRGVSTGVIAGAAEGLVMSTMAAFILTCPRKYIRYISIRISGFIILSSALGIYVFFVYSFFPSSYNPASGEIMHSEVGNKRIYAESIYDYLCFTSGDGFQLFNIGAQSNSLITPNANAVMRVKGYCNEPSATICHYLAPIVLMLHYRKIPLLAVVIPVFFTLICISSFIGIITLFGSIVIYGIFKLKNSRLIYWILVGMLFLGGLFLVKVNQLGDFFQVYGRKVFEATGHSLMERKANSADVRLESLTGALDAIIINPFGGVGATTPSGLWLSIGLVGGVGLILIYFIFINKIIKHSIISFSEKTTIRSKLSVSLIISVVMSATLISSYGWDGIPGVIILLLYYRILSENSDGAVQRIIKPQFSLK